MAKKGISLKQAQLNATNNQSGGNTIFSEGFEERQIGPHIVNVFYYRYRVEYPDLTEKGKDWNWEYRYDLYVDGKVKSGGYIGS